MHEIKRESTRRSSNGQQVGQYGHASVYERMANPVDEAMATHETWQAESCLSISQVDLKNRLMTLIDGRLRGCDGGCYCHPAGKARA